MNLSLSDSFTPSTNDWLISQGYSPDDLNQPGQNGDTALMKAVQTGTITQVEELIQAGADLNRRNQDGNNALWFACFKNHLELIHRLIDAGIAIDNQNDNGATALMYAASAGKTEIVQVLLQRGANPMLILGDSSR
ncbi:MAG: hypothetical protein OHK0047_12490 [Leptolyngbyaceae cyanobacterium]